MTTDQKIDKIFETVNRIELQNRDCINDHNDHKRELLKHDIAFEKQGNKIEKLEAYQNQQVGKRTLLMLLFTTIAGSIGAAINHFWK